MMPENQNPFSNDDQPLRSGENSNDDRLPDASNSDAAAENARQGERIHEASRASSPSSQAAEDKAQDQTKPGSVNQEEPLTTQGSEEEIEENLSGTTNLTIEQLKKEKDPGGYSLEGPEGD